MSKNKSNRRQFLEITGFSLAGIALVSASGIPNIAGQQVDKQTQTNADTSFEEWLLSTGADDIQPDLYQKVLVQLK